ncbi:MAG: hypothetical protein JW761_11655 [Prolixibacteraceae bacterium]|nr:hypothetical protein [Prolixibacteraceae bacterium]
MKNSTTKNDICCPKFDPAPWEEKVFQWKNKKFIKDNVFTVFYMPVNFGNTITKMNRKVEAVQGKVSDWMCLSDHTSKWNMDLYLAVDKVIPNAKNLTMSGTYVTKVYEGDFKETGNWGKDFDAWCLEKEYHLQKTYMWYTTCPKCAIKYGKNYVVFVAKIQQI